MVVIDTLPPCSFSPRLVAWLVSGAYSWYAVVRSQRRAPYALSRVVLSPSSHPSGCCTPRFLAKLLPASLPSQGSTALGGEGRCSNRRTARATDVCRVGETAQASRGQYQQ